MVEPNLAMYTVTCAHVSYFFKQFLRTMSKIYYTERACDTKSIFVSCAAISIFFFCSLVLIELFFLILVTYVCSIKLCLEHENGTNLATCNGEKKTVKYV